MKEAVIGAVELLGSTDLNKWDQIIQDAEYDPDPFRRFFTIAAVRDLKIFMNVVGRMIPSHVIHSKQQQFMTVTQARQELRAAGVPDSALKHMPTFSIHDVDPDEVVGKGRRKSPYDDPEALDVERLVDVTPSKEEPKS
jgi:TATA-box binding protein (TBP) (component of TFIID and TFIIIB)